LPSDCRLFRPDRCRAGRNHGRPEFPGHWSRRWSRPAIQAIHGWQTDCPGDCHPMGHAGILRPDLPGRRSVGLNRTDLSDPPRICQEANKGIDTRDRWYTMSAVNCRHPWNRFLLASANPPEPHPAWQSKGKNANLRKAGSDHLVRAYFFTYGLPITISNCSNNYGPYHFPEKLIPLFINNIITKKPLPVYGDGLYTRDWLFVKDHATAIDIVFHKGKINDTYNIGGFNEWKNIDLVKALCRIMDKKLGRNPGTSASVSSGS